MVLLAQIMKEDDRNWPEPDKVGCQELEVRRNGEEISFATTKLGNLLQVQQSKDPEGLRIFYYLVQVRFLLQMPFPLSPSKIAPQLYLSVPFAAPSQHPLFNVMPLSWHRNRPPFPLPQSQTLLHFVHVVYCCIVFTANNVLGLQTWAISCMPLPLCQKAICVQFCFTWDLMRFCLPCRSMALGTRLRGESRTIQ